MTDTCLVVYSMTPTPARLPTSRRRTCIRTTARNTRRGFARRSRRAGKTPTEDSSARRWIQQSCAGAFFNCFLNMGVVAFVVPDSSITLYFIPAGRAFEEKCSAHNIATPLVNQ